MGTSKSDHFTNTEQRTAVLAKALGHPARVAILLNLAKKNECVCNEIVDGLPLSQSTVSQHLKELLNAGFIKGRIDGAKSCYCINRGVWQEAKNLLVDLFASFPDGDSCCKQ